MWVAVYSVIVFVLIGTGHGVTAIPVALKDDVLTKTAEKASSLHGFVAQ